MIGELASSVYQEELYSIPKKTYVVVTEPWEQVGESERVLLQKILQAVGLTIDMVVVAHQSVFSAKALSQNASRIIYFGEAVNGITQFEATTVEEVPVILSTSLPQLQADAAAKQKLWTGLRSLFGR